MIYRKIQPRIYCKYTLLFGVLIVYTAHAISTFILVNTMTISAALIQSIISLIAGILILIRPQLLNFIVALALIVIGAIGIAKAFGLL